MSDILRMIAVTTTPATTVEKGYLQVTAGTRAVTDKLTGKKKEIPADQKSRSIIIPEFQPQVSSKYVSIVVSALAQAAKDQLQQQWKDDPMLREVQAAQYTEDAILAFSARQAESKRLSGESIVDWWNQSALKIELSKKYSDSQLGRFIEELQHVAAPTITWDEALCTKRIATLGMVEEDTEHEVCAAMIRRLAAKIDAIKKIREAVSAQEELPI